MRMVIFTGNERTTTSLSAAATATRLAAQGRRTLLASMGPVHTLGGLLHHTTAPQPLPFSPNLDIWLPDSLDAMGAVWDERRATVGGPMAKINGDELPTLPGSDLLITLYGLRDRMQQYDTVVLDAGDYGELLRALTLPDSFRWGLRLLLGLDRGPGRSPQSQGRALVPTALLPFEWLGQVQNARVAVEELRDITTHTNGATVGFVLSPDAPALAQAQFTVPALQLHGLAVAALLVGPLLPTTSSDTTLATIAAQQQAVVSQTREHWSPRPLLTLPLVAPTMDAVAFLEQHMYHDATPDQLFNAVPPIAIVPGPAIALHLPLLQRGALRLTVSGDELIVRVGPYRRHLLLPDGLRGVSAIKATRSGEQIVIGRRDGS